MTTPPRVTRVPTPLYAVAGASDLAYERLRRVSAVVSSLGDEAVRTELRERSVATTAELRRRALATTAELRDRAVLALRNADAARLRQRVTGREFDLHRLREATIRNAAAVVAGAQQRVLSVYGDLVARGERVVGSGTVDTDRTAAAATATDDAVVVREPAVPTSPSPAEASDRAETPKATADAGAAAAPARKAAPKQRTARKTTRPAVTGRPRGADDA